MRSIITFFAILLATLAVDAQNNLQPDPPHREWQASWVTHPTAPLREPVVLHFRRTLYAGSRPGQPTRFASAPTTASFSTSTAIAQATARPAVIWPTGAMSASTWPRCSSPVKTSSLRRSGTSASTPPIAQIPIEPPFCWRVKPPGPAPSAPPKAGWSNRNRAKALSIVADRYACVHGLSYRATSLSTSAHSVRRNADRSRRRTPPWQPNDWSSITSWLLRLPCSRLGWKCPALHQVAASTQTVVNQGLRTQGEWHPEAVVNLRLLGKGVGWAFGIEGVAAMCLYAIWFVWHFRP